MNNERRGVEIADTRTAKMRGVATSGRQRVRITLRRESAWNRLPGAHRLAKVRRSSDLPPLTLIARLSRDHIIVGGRD